MKGSSNVIKSVSKGWKKYVSRRKILGEFPSILELAAYCESVNSELSLALEN